MNSDTNRPTVSLDVRPILAAGEEPFDAIIQAADELTLGGQLELTAPFEPVPLYRVLSRRGFAHRSEMRGPDHWIVRFTQTGITADTTVGETYERHPAAAGVLAEHGLDCCCGGGHSLEFAAKAHQVDLPRLLAELQQAAIP